MKTLILVTALAALPAFAATGSYPPGYGHQRPTRFAPDSTPAARTDGNPMPSSYDPASLRQDQDDVSPNDNPAPRLDGNRTPGMFREGRR